ncbi:PadR family transcriptional regulator [Nocardioides sp. zg-DK7169]|uniref:PadR family transcriptional regulator n=1 Tax=Nocardioides sp. zg-DK7169 TaxID=2736600 RepID=UPI001555A152|nr:PadR family transcriptional regulator [Nocardioides sp. zg-DK7169]NPC95521.1 PadR family transcriptional regulator [Nocardioides sp. zg-DK7169]
MSENPRMAALRRGMLEPLVLTALDRRQRYPAEIVAALRDAGFPAQEGTLYPLLTKLGREGAVTHEWRESSSGPPRKYLSLTPAGERQLSEFRAYWRDLTDTIEQIGRHS